MKWSDSLAMKAASAVLATGGVLANPLTTIDPCPSATTISFAPITVTAQFQPISTCVATTACVKGKCSTTYPFTTYSYVSTVVPYAWNGTTTQVTTVTDVAQPFRVSEYLETVTQITAVPTPNTHHRAWFKANKKKPTAKSTTVYETVTRRAMAPFNKIGPLPIPGWEGSGLCEECEHSQLLDVIECRSGINAGKAYNRCVQWEETLVELPTQSSTVATEALCSSQGKIPHAGVYTWTFPQSAPPSVVAGCRGMDSFFSRRCPASNSIRPNKRRVGRPGSIRRTRAVCKYERLPLPAYFVGVSHRGWVLHHNISRDRTRIARQSP